MIKIFKSLIIIIFFNTITLQANSETSWITKKSDKSKEEIKIEKKIKKKDIKEKNKWIKKKKKEIKKKFNNENKKITKEVKSWISKKRKKDDIFYTDFYDLPESDSYLIGRSENRIFYGYIDNKKLDTENYSTNKNYIAFFNDGKTTCYITISEAPDEKMSGNCSDKLKFRGFTDSVVTNDGQTYKISYHNNTLRLAQAYAKHKEYIDKPKQRASAVPTKRSKIEPEGKYYALIIANSNYKHNDIWSNLKSPVNDGDAIQKILKNKYKFKNVWLVKDASRDKIFDEIDKLSKIITDKDYLLIYYAGHGQRVNNKAYWVGVNSSSKNAYYKMVNVNELTNSLENIKARHIFFMIDSCYAGISFNSKSSKIEEVDSDENAIKKSLINYSRKVLTSGHNQKVIDTYFENKHSLFAEGFLKILKENNTSFTAETLYVKIKKLHQMDQSLEQIPKYGPIPNLKLTIKDIAVGDFVFHVPNK